MNNTEEIFSYFNNEGTAHAFCLVHVAAGNLAACKAEAAIPGWHFQAVGELNCNYAQPEKPNLT